MAQAYKCDICGKLFTQKELGEFILIKKNYQIQATCEHLIRDDRDLCPSCMKHFAIWVKSWKACEPCRVPTDEH